MVNGNAYILFDKVWHTSVDVILVWLVDLVTTAIIASLSQTVNVVHSQYLFHNFMCNRYNNYKPYVIKIPKRMWSFSWHALRIWLDKRFFFILIVELLKKIQMNGPPSPITQLRSWQDKRYCSKVVVFLKSPRLSALCAIILHSLGFFLLRIWPISFFLYLHLKLRWIFSIFRVFMVVVTITFNKKKLESCVRFVYRTEKNIRKFININLYRKTMAN